jgi:hypothetical protein
VEPWHRILIRGIFFVIVGVACFWGGVSLTTRLNDEKKPIGIVLAVVGIALFLYSFRYISRFLIEYCTF